MSKRKPWSWTESRDDLAVAFFGRHVATAAADLLPHLDPPPETMSWLRQIHSNGVRVAQPGLAGDGDALISTQSGIAVAVATADCVPVLLATSHHIAAVHAGWRGLVAGVLPASLAAIGSDPETTEVWIGPAIGPCCYEIGDDVAESLGEVATDAALTIGPGNRIHADLQAIARHQLQGVRHIRQIDLCTRCEQDSLASYRRDGDAAGRNWAVIWRPGA